MIIHLDRSQVDCAIREYLQARGMSLPVGDFIQYTTVGGEKRRFPIIKYKTSWIFGFDGASVTAYVPDRIKPLPELTAYRSEP